MTIGVQYQPASTARHCYASEGLQTGRGRTRSNGFARDWTQNRDSFAIIRGQKRVVGNNLLVASDPTGKNQPLVHSMPKC
jgi:hypothetical protein